MSVHKVRLASSTKNVERLVFLTLGLPTIKRRNLSLGILRFLLIWALTAVPRVNLSTHLPLNPM